MEGKLEYLALCDSRQRGYITKARGGVGNTCAQEHAMC